MSDEEDQVPTPDDLELMGDLGRLAREGGSDVVQKEREQWAEWEALSAGSLSSEALARLRARALDDEELAARLEAFRPLDPELKERLVQTAVRGGAAPESTPAAGRRGRSTWAWVGAASLAVAAALLLFVRLPAPTESLAPAMTSELSRGARSERGETQDRVAVPSFHPETAFRWNLRPEQARPGVEVVPFLEVAGVRGAWNPPVQIGARGGVLISGPARALFGDLAGAVTVGATLTWPDGVTLEVREPVYLEGTDP